MSYLLTVAMLLVAVQGMGTLFLAQSASALMVLCAIAALVAAPLLISPLSDWSCWLIVQVLAIVAAVRFADSSLVLAPSLGSLSSTALAIAVPEVGPFHGGVFSLGQHGAEWTLLVLLGVLTWELAWGVLWLTLRAGYLWAAIIMAGASLLTTANVDHSIEARFPAFLLLGLLLVLWYTWSERIARAWLQVPALQPRGTAYVSLLGGLCTLLVLPFAWLVAPLPNTALTTWSNRAMADIWSQLRKPIGLHDASTDSGLGPTGFGTTVRMNGPFRPRPGTVLQIAGAPAEALPYWRGQVYDRYTPDGWQSAALIQTDAAAMAPILAHVPRHPARDVEVTVEEMQTTGGLLFAPGRPILTNLAAQIAYGIESEGNEPASVTRVDQRATAMTYRILSELPAPAPHAGSAGPAADSWYTALPGALDPRIRHLASRIVVGAVDDLARARAIERYLRGGTFTYDAEATTPAGSDPLSYFLFESKRGYCVHFASAMSVLARASGLAARVVGGFVTGTRRGDSWVVRGSDAHTWAEVFFAGTGWVPFEPTPGFAAQPTAAAQRAATHRAAPASGGQARTVPHSAPREIPPVMPAATVRSAPPSRIPGAVTWLPVAALALLGAGAAVWTRGRRRGSTVAQIYRRMCRLARWLAIAPQLGQTPNEFARMFATRGSDEWRDVERVTALYVATRYGGLRASQPQLDAARHAVRRLRRRWLARRLAPWRGR